MISLQPLSSWRQPLKWTEPKRSRALGAWQDAQGWSTRHSPLSHQSQRLEDPGGSLAASIRLT